MKFYGSTKLKKHKSWKVFSQYIRLRDKNCVTCPFLPTKKVFGKAENCGHYHAGSVCGKELYFSEINNNGQCVTCNLWNSGERDAYALFLTRKYGPDILEKLNAIRLKEKNEKIICRYSEEELELIHRTYKQKLADMVN